MTALGVALAAAAQPPCPPAPAEIAVFVRNLSADASITAMVAGELVDPTATCAGTGDAAYARTLECAGSGLVACGTIPGLRPGAWVNHLSATVTGQSAQTQHQRTVVVAGSPSNVLVWTIYPRTVIVADATEMALRAALLAASPGPALVTFSPDAFPATIHLAQGPCPAGHQAALCVTDSGIVVDALDPSGRPGAVRLSVDALPISVLHLFGSDDVFRGLVLDGSTTAMPKVQSDTFAFTGAGARRSRLEQSIVHGPSRGDAVSADTGAGAEGADANVVDGCEVTGAKDKGVKVTTGAHATVRATCLHDNMNGGIQATLGGHVTALENVIQHNVPGGAQNGIMVRGLSACLADPAANCDEPSTGVTGGNIVRFHGGRGLTATDNALASFVDDYVADNQIIGSRIETTSSDPPTAAQPGGAVPVASFRGVALVCNANAGVSGTCQPPPVGGEATPCGSDTECCGLPTGCCVTDPGCISPLRCAPPASVPGFGATVAQASGKPAPQVDYGTATDAGENAFAWNVSQPGGANFKVNVAGLQVSAAGNEWQACAAGMTCNSAAILAQDVVTATGANVSLAPPAVPAAGIPVVDKVSPARPAKGELVHVYGHNFNAIDGAACERATAPADPCSGANPSVERQNLSTNANTLAVLAGPGDVLASVWPDAVTPTMIAFRMPVDCFALLTLQVGKKDATGAVVSTSFPLCDPGGCAGRAAGDPCDDGDACTVGELCDGQGVCRPAGRVVCAGPCLTGACDPTLGCLVRPATAWCDDGDPCTTGDHCSGIDDRCVAGSTACDDGDPCTTGDVCSAGVCRGVPLPGFDGSICEMGKALVPPLCTAERGGPRLERVADRRLRMAQALLRRAAATSRPAVRDRLLRRSAAVVRVIGELAAQYRRSGTLSRACALLVRNAVQERRRLVLALVV